MLGGTVGAVSPGGEDLLTVTVVRDENGYGMKVSGDNPVYVQSVKEHGAAWRAGLRAGDRILRVDSVPVHHHTHQQVVHMIRANPTTVLTVQQTSRHKTPITAPVPVNPEKQRQIEKEKAETVQLMLERELKYIRDLRNELLKVPDVRKQAELESAEQRCNKLQSKIDTIMAGQPSTPRLARSKDTSDRPSAHAGFLSGLPRSLSNLTGQSLRSLRQARQAAAAPAPAPPPPLLRQGSAEGDGRGGAGRRGHHNHTVPLVPTTCLDNSPPPPLPPRKPPGPNADLVSPPAQHRASLSPDGPQPNSIALQLSYPLVNVPPPPLLNDNRNSVPVLHVRSQSSPEHLDHEMARSSAAAEKEAWSRGTPPPGTPPPPYPHPAQPCSDPQRAIISMEEDDSPTSENSMYPGLFSNLRTVLESKARMAVLINWLLGERRCACAGLLLTLTEAFRGARAAGGGALRRWAYEIHSVFLMPNAVLQLNGVDENMANEIEHVLVNEYEKEERLRNVFRKARRLAKEELARQLGEFQLKRQLGLATLYGPDDAALRLCQVDRAQEALVVERIMCQRLRAVAQAAPGGGGGGGAGGGGGGGAGGCAAAGAAGGSPEAHAALLAALAAVALCLHCRPAAVAAAVGGSRASFLQRDKLYKQRVKQLTKQHPQPFIVRGHHLQLRALTSVAHCHHCDLVIWGLAPQAVVCTDCKLRLHRGCARLVEEGCCLEGGGEAPNNRISRFMERIHPNSLPGQDSNDRKSRKASGAANFLNMERSFRKMEDEPPWEPPAAPAHSQERRDESDESLYESADCHSDVISASDDALPRLGRTPTMSKESLKLAVTDEEGETRTKKGHRKTMSLSNPLEIVKTLGDEWFDHKKDIDKHCDKKKSRESLWSEEDSFHGSTVILDQRKNSKKDEKNEAKDAKRKSCKGSSVSSFNFLRRKKTPTPMKSVEAVVEVDGTVSPDEILKTKLFLEEEKKFASISEIVPVETDSEEEVPTKKVEHRRRLSRQTSRSKSKVRGKSQTVKVNTLRKSHSGTLKKAKKKSFKAPISRSRQASIVEPIPIVKKKNSDAFKQNSWLFRGESRREGSTEEQSTPDLDNDANDNSTKEVPDKEHNWRGASATSRGVNRAESCRERDAPRRGKHRNASDPNRLTAHPSHDLEPGAVTAPSGSSSSSSLSSRSNESNTVATEQQDWSEEEEPLAAQWSDSLPPGVRDTIVLCARLRKRQEVIHELIVSEGSHVRWLKVLGGDFLKPLERQPALLPAEELRALFPNLPGVTERHARLYGELRAARAAAPGHVVRVRPVADALLNTLGEAGYAACLARFCRGQRMALEALRERRRKHKELQQFLAGREQLPRCGRLQLRDLLACVWQRLTKYQLLLEGILKTVTEDQSEEDAESEEDIAQLRKALQTAKEVLHSVDTAIRTAENEHRLKTIQSKLEVRAPVGPEWEELRRLELPQHALRMEGELLVRTDTKKMSVLALMLEDSLVLLQREADRFLLRPIAQPSQNTLLSPLIKWDKVLFRPNAAMRNTFFLMNINGIQMHELSATTAAEYSTWVRLIQESRLAETRPSQLHQHTRSADDSGINVSRNPSDASEKSASSAPPEDTCDSDRELRDLKEREAQDKEREAKDKERELREKEREVLDNDREKVSLEREEKTERLNRSLSIDKDEGEEKHRRRATVGRITTHVGEGGEGGGGGAGLVEGGAVAVRPPLQGVLTAQRVLSHTERLRRLDAALQRALLAKSAAVAELLGVPPASFAHVAELAVADTLGHADFSDELAPAEGEPDIHQLLLAAQAQANQLTEALSGAMTLSEAGAVRARSGRCDSCRGRLARPPAHPRTDDSVDDSTLTADATVTATCDATATSDSTAAATRSPDASFDLLTDVESELPAAAADDYPALVLACGAPGAGPRACPGAGPAAGAAGGEGAAALARRLAALSCGLQAALGRLVAALPELLAERRALRAALAAGRERAARRDHDKKIMEDLSFANDIEDQSIQEQPSNGG